MKIYTIPGLGFDHRIFSKLDLGKKEVHHLDWIEPEHEESFLHYADRLAKPLDKSGEKITLIGHSLGGLLSQEIARIRKIERIFLISSIKSRDEMPIFFRMGSKVPFHKLFTKDLTLNTFKHWGKNHDYVSEEEQALFKDMVSKQSDRYLQWALMRLSQWQNPRLPRHTRLFHIHGDEDKTFPIRSIQNPDAVISGGGHFMVYKHHEKISKIILDFLNQ